MLNNDDEIPAILRPRTQGRELLNYLGGLFSPDKTKFVAYTYVRLEANNFDDYRFMLESGYTSVGADSELQKKWVTERTYQMKSMEEWTYPQPRYSEWAYHYAEDIIRDIRGISDWDDLRFLDSSRTMENPRFWSEYVLGTENGKYRWLEEIPGID